MRSLSLMVLFGFFLCSSCIELDVQNNGSSSTSSSTASSSSGNGSSGGGVGGAGGNDVTSGSGGNSGAAFCDSNDPTLIACYEFEGNAMDGSKYANPTMAPNLKYDVGVVGQAASFDKTVQVAIGNGAPWDISQYTVELWYYQKSYSTGRMGLFDSDNRLGMFVYGQGDLRCSRSPDIVVTVPGMPLGAWNHVACVFDGMTLSMYVNGELKGTVIAPAITNGGTTAIGSNAPSGDYFDGLIDNVRVWNVAHSAAEVCASIGKQGC